MKLSGALWFDISRGDADAGNDDEQGDGLAIWLAGKADAGGCVDDAEEVVWGDFLRSLGRGGVGEGKHDDPEELKLDDPMEEDASGATKGHCEGTGGTDPSPPTPASQVDEGFLVVQRKVRAKVKLQVQRELQGSSPAAAAAAAARRQPLTHDAGTQAAVHHRRPRPRRCNGRAIQCELGSEALRGSPSAALADGGGGDVAAVCCAAAAASCEVDPEARLDALVGRIGRLLGSTAAAGVRASVGGLLEAARLAAAHGGFGVEDVAEVAQVFAELDAECDRLELLGFDGCLVPELGKKEEVP